MLAKQFEAYEALPGLHVKDGLIGDQRFFIAYAQSRAVRSRTETLRQIVLTSSHAPEQFQAIMVRNIDACTGFQREAGAEALSHP